MIDVWLTGWPGVGWPARGWPQRTVPTSRPGAPDPGLLRVSMARHPSFTAERAATVIVGLPWPQLCRTWAQSTRALDDVGCADANHGLVLLRAALLDEMQRSHPQAFADWFAREWGRSAPAAIPPARRQGSRAVD